MEPSIAIIGGGVAGLLTAVALQRKGIEATVFEQQPAGLLHNCITLRTTAIDRLHQLGVLRPLLPYITTINYTETYTAQGFLRSRRTVTGKTFVLEQQFLQQVLRQSLQPGQLQTGKQCVHINRISGKPASLYFTDGSYAAAGAVIGADGLNSFVRKNYFTGNASLYAGYVCWKGYAEMPNSFFVPGTNYCFEQNDWYFKVTVLPGNKLHWQAVAAVAEAAASGLDASCHHVLAYFGNWCPEVKAVIAATAGECIKLCDYCYPQEVKNIVQYPLALSGDAAHPMLQQQDCMGVTQAIEDAVCLQYMIARYGITSKAFAGYEKSRVGQCRRSIGLQKIKNAETKVYSSIRTVLERVWRPGMVFHETIEYDCESRSAARATRQPAGGARNTGHLPGHLQQDARPVQWLQ
ncbi:FAD-dependent monooxygenase [Deminuibacter soli]|uniref:FAD-binding domain-containing protein n=1 Tax=Deminuibacter soli TaxID=2291815 RepID=A0A3E1ND31_9BACT|nr:FAD-dependent monooxygenase [Deminuibacter soli]RFM25724.1 hypothetical protein DXN05_23730 [Deminuibacter soli]